jgi:hypothetical protein
MTKLKLKKGKRKVILFGTILFSLAVIFSLIYVLIGKANIIPSSTKYTANIDEPVNLFNKDLKHVEIIYRGVKVGVYNDKIKDDSNNTYVKINYKGKQLYINEKYLTDKKEGIIKETTVYVRTPTTLYKNTDTGEIASLSKKGDELTVLGYDIVNDKGKVNVYKVKSGEQEGYVYQKYVLPTKDEAIKNYDPTKYYDVHNNRGNRFGGGYAGNLDYYPVEKPTFKDNVMPKKVYALYLNDGSNIIGKVDSYIEYAKTTKINAFVVDIKDAGAPGYKSKVFETMSPTNFKKANNSFDKYKDAITKIKNAGFYVIGRISVFKDMFYCMDHPEDAITDTRTGQPYLHSENYWPSPYQRSVWEFNVNLAKEAVKEMGFNEIQFDYARFPDKTGDAEKSGLMDFHNDYGEEKAQAIQGFIRYATDELHKLKAYVSVDVFGESAYTYVTAYGQYWAAISNIVDVISGMPYPDHFNKYEFDFTVPVWTVPYDLLYKWGTYVTARQQEIPTPAILRTWVQVSDVPSYKHPGGYAYGVEQIDAEIRGLVNAGLTSGYMTWLSTSSLDRYKSEKEVYDKEY